VYRLNTRASLTVGAEVRGAALRASTEQHIYRRCNPAASVLTNTTASFRKTRTGPNPLSFFVDFGPKNSCSLRLHATLLSRKWGLVASVVD